MTDIVSLGLTFDSGDSKKEFSEVTQTINKFLDRLKASDEEIKRLTKSVTRITTTNSALQRQLGSLNKENRQLQKENKKLIGDFEKLNNEFKQYRKNTQGAAQDTDRLGKATNRASGQMFAFAGSVLLVNKAVAAFSDVVKVGAEFERGLNRLEILGQVDAKGLESEFASLTDRIKELGRETEFTSTQVLDAAKSITLLTGNLEDAEDFLKPVIQLSTLLGDSVDDAASLVAKTLNQFNLEASEAARVSNLFAAAAVNSSADLGFMSRAITRTSKLTTEYGFEVEDITTALALMSKTMKDMPERAGTGMKTFFVRLLNLTGDAQQSLKDFLGLEIGDFFKEGTSDLKDFEEILTLLAQGMDRLQGNALGASAVTQIFGTEAVLSLLELLKVTEDNTLAFAEMKQAITGAGDILSKTDDLSKDFTASMKRFQAAIEGLKISIFDEIKEPLGAGLDILSDFLVKIQDTGVIKDFSVVLKALLPVLLAVAGAFTALLLGAAGGALVAAFGALSVAMTKVVAVGAAIGAIFGSGALLASFVDFVKGSELMTASLQEVKLEMQLFVVAAENFFIDFAEAALSVGNAITHIFIAPFVRLGELVQNGAHLVAKLFGFSVKEAEDAGKAMSESFNTAQSVISDGADKRRAALQEEREELQKNLSVTRQRMTDLKESAAATERAKKAQEELNQILGSAVVDRIDADEFLALSEQGKAREKSAKELLKLKQEIRTLDKELILVESANVALLDDGRIQLQEKLFLKEQEIEKEIELRREAMLANEALQGPTQAALDQLKALDMILVKKKQIAREDIITNDVMQLLDVHLKRQLSNQERLSVLKKGQLETESDRARFAAQAARAELESLRTTINNEETYSKLQQLLEERIAALDKDAKLTQEIKDLTTLIKDETKSREELLRDNLKLSEQIKKEEIKLLVLKQKEKFLADDGKLSIEETLQLKQLENNLQHDILTAVLETKKAEGTITEEELAKLELLKKQLSLRNEINKQAAKNKSIVETNKEQTEKTKDPVKEFTDRIKEIRKIEKEMDKKSMNMDVNQLEALQDLRMSHEEELADLQQKRFEAMMNNAKSIGDVLSASFTKASGNLEFGQAFGGQLASGISGAGSNASRGASVANAAMQGSAAGPIGALVMGAAQAVLSNEKIKESIDKAFEGLFNILDPFIELLAPFIDAFAEIGEAFTELLVAISFIEPLVPVIKELGEIFGSFAKSISDTIGAFINEIRKFTGKVQDFINSIPGVGKGSAGGGIVGQVVGGPVGAVAGLLGGGKKKKKDKNKGSIMTPELEAVFNTIDEMLNPLIEFSNKARGAVSVIDHEFGRLRASLRKHKDNLSPEDFQAELKKIDAVKAFALAQEGFFDQARELIVDLPRDLSAMVHLGINQLRRTKQQEFLSQVEADFAALEAEAMEPFEREVSSIKETWSAFNDELRESQIPMADEIKLMNDQNAAIKILNAMREETIRGLQKMAEDYKQLTEDIKTRSKLAFDISQVFLEATGNEYEHSLNEVKRTVRTSLQQQLAVVSDLEDRKRITVQEANQKRNQLLVGFHLKELKDVEDFNKQRQDEAKEARDALVQIMQGELTGLDAVLKDVTDNINKLAEEALAANKAAGGDWMGALSITLMQSHLLAVETAKATQEYHESLEGTLPTYDLIKSSLDSTGSAILNVQKKYNDLVKSHDFSLDQMKEIGKARVSELTQVIEEEFSKSIKMVKGIEDKIQAARGRIFGTITPTMGEIEKMVSVLQQLNVDGITDPEAIQERVDLVEAVLDGVNQVAEAQEQSINKQVEAIRSLVEVSRSLGSTMRELRFGELNVQDIDVKLSDAAEEFKKLRKSAFTAARTVSTEDDKAIQEFEEFATTFLTVSQEAFKSSAKQVANFEQVQKDLDALQSLIDSDLANRAVTLAESPEQTALESILNSLDGVASSFKTDILETQEKLLKVNIKPIGDGITYNEDTQIATYDNDLTIATHIKKLLNKKLQDPEGPITVETILDFLARTKSGKEAKDGVINDTMEMVINTLLRNGNTKELAEGGILKEFFEAHASIDGSGEDWDPTKKEFSKELIGKMKFGGKVNNQDMEQLSDGSLKGEVDVSVATEFKDGFTRLETVILLNAAMVSRSIFEASFGQAVGGTRGAFDIAEGLEKNRIFVQSFSAGMRDVFKNAMAPFAAEFLTDTAATTKKILDAQGVGGGEGSTSPFFERGNSVAFYAAQIWASVDRMGWYVNPDNQKASPVLLGKLGLIAAVNNTELKTMNSTLNSILINTRAVAHTNTQLAFNTATLNASNSLAFQNVALPIAQTGGMIGGNRHSNGGTLVNAEAGEMILSRIGVSNLQAMGNANQQKASRAEMEFTAMRKAIDLQNTLTQKLITTLEEKDMEVNVNVADPKIVAQEEIAQDNMRKRNMAERTGQRQLQRIF